MGEHSYRAFLAPVAEGEPRPLWSVMIPTHNCLSWTEDWEMWVRIAANYPVWFLRHELGQRARLRADQCFSLEVIGQQMRQFLFSSNHVLDEVKRNINNAKVMKQIH